MAIMITDASTFGDGLTLEETWKIANDMPITPLFFAEVSCEGDRIFGLHTAGCGGSTCEDACSDPLFPCVRRQLWRELQRVTQDTEAHLHWPLKKRYVEETLTYFGKDRLMLSLAGVDKADVEEVITTLDSYGPVSFTVTIGKVVELVNSGPPNNIIEAYLPKDIVSNPRRIMFRKVSDNNPIMWDDDLSGYPKTGTATSGENCWIVPLKQPSGTHVDVTDELWMVDCQIAFFDAPDPTGVDCTGDIEPVYPGTTQKIPYIKKETLSTGEIRYWVNIRSMINPEFLGEEIRLDEGEFYKFIETVEFACFGERQKLAVVYFKPNSSTCTDGSPCQEQTSYACTTLIDKRLGIAELHLVELVLDSNGDPTYDDDGNYVVQDRTDCSNLGDPIRVDLAYHVDPYATGIQYHAAIEHLRKAIAGRVAAEVQITDCGCEVENGYFKKMQTVPETRIENRFTGTSIIMSRYTDMYGTQMWWQAIMQSPRMVRPVIL